MEKIRVAGVQTDPKILEKEDNLESCMRLIQVAARNDSKLIVFPECSLTGYCFSSLAEGLSIAERIPGPSTLEIASLCKELRVHTIVGLLEKDGDKCFNSVAFIGPDGVIGRYRKIHLPYLGIDRFATPGDEPHSVHITDLGRIGMQICFDVRLPESARVLALSGAEVIVLPTNWPEGAEPVSEFVINTRAYENRVNYVAVNRVGKERGFRFIGQSIIVDFQGKTLAKADPMKEEIIYAQLDIAGARNKHIVLVPGEFELPLFEARRPEFYSILLSKR